MMSVEFFPTQQRQKKNDVVGIFVLERPAQKDHHSEQIIWASLMMKKKMNSSRCKFFLAAKGIDFSLEKKNFVIDHPKKHAFSYSELFYTSIQARIFLNLLPITSHVPNLAR